MSREKQIDIITDLLIDFDEMGFAPTTLVPDPEAYAIKWRTEITKALEDCFKQSEWISVEERLPDNCRSVLVALKGLTIGGAPSMVIGSYSGGFWMVADADGTHYLTKYMRYEVTHWMPLPEAPKMTRKEDEEK